MVYSHNSKQAFLSGGLYVFLVNMVCCKWRLAPIEKHEQHFYKATILLHIVASVNYSPALNSVPKIEMHFVVSAVCPQVKKHHINQL